MFDSLGSSKAFVEKNIPFKVVVDFNTDPVQAPYSSSCGEFCIFFISQRLLNLDLFYSDFLHAIFSSDLSINEQRVKDFFDQHE